MAALLDVKNLGISFGGLRAVNGFDISIGKEEHIRRFPAHLLIVFCFVDLHIPFLLISDFRWNGYKKNQISKV